MGRACGQSKAGAVLRPGTASSSAFLRLEGGMMLQSRIACTERPSSTASKSCRAAAVIHKTGQNDPLTRYLNPLLSDPQPQSPKCLSAAVSPRFRRQKAAYGRELGKQEGRGAQVHIGKRSKLPRLMQAGMLLTSAPSAHWLFRQINPWKAGTACCNMARVFGHQVAQPDSIRGKNADLNWVLSIPHMQYCFRRRLSS